MALDALARHAAVPAEARIDELGARRPQGRIASRCSALDDLDFRADERVIQAMVGDREDCHLICPRTGADTSRVAHEQSPARVDLDIPVPDVTGCEVCRRLRAHPVTESVPAVFVPPFAEGGHERDGFDAGAVGSVVKPVAAPQSARPTPALTSPSCAPGGSRSATAKPS